MFTEHTLENHLICRLCPHGCRIKRGRSGVCGVRYNKGGELELPYYGRISSIADDPIEKKPLYHFYPASRTFSVGFWGCNLSCPFCQNWSISQQHNKDSLLISPSDLIDKALDSHTSHISFTYSEPLVHFEYVLEAARQAQQSGLKTILVSNGMITGEAADLILPHIDAANIDLKSFSGDYYRSVLKGDLKTVLDFITKAFSLIHLEVTTLLVPGDNDSPGEMADIVSFLSSLSPEIPYHLSAYYPQYRYTKKATDPKSLLDAVRAAREKLRYVYPGNIAGSSDTVCPGCRTTIIRRNGYRTEIAEGFAGSCPSCGFRIYGSF